MQETRWNGQLQRMLNQRPLIKSDLILHLASLGDVVPLDFTLDVDLIQEQLKPFDDEWKQYNPRKPNDRQGLSITSLDGGLSGIPDLDSIFEYNKLHNTHVSEAEINVKTRVAEQVTALHPLIDKFNLGRSHFIRLNRGGHFPPHRDGKILGVTCFRVLTMCHNCKDGQFQFTLEDKVYSFEPGRPYFVNTRKNHNVFSFVDNSVQCVLNLPLTEENYNCVVKHLQMK